VRKKKVRNLVCFYQNVRGLRSKTNIFMNNVTHCKFDVIALTETFLTSSVSDGELFPSDYTVVRKDRSNDVGWGGVLLAVRNTYTLHGVVGVDGSTSDMELIFAIISGKNVSKFLCCVVYLPPSYKDDQYLSVLTSIENAIVTYSTLNVIILGDFNLNSCSADVKTNFLFFL
jgi:exonuclease III